MTNGLKETKIINYLDCLYPNPKCELIYNKDYELLIAVMLSAQTTDKRVNEVTKVLFNKYNSLEKLSKANVKDIEDIIRPLGIVKKSSYIIGVSKYLYESCDSKVPNDKDILLKLPGVGIKTVNVVLSNLFDYPAIAVDTHVSRVSKRLGYAKEDDTPEVIEKKLEKKFPKDKWARLHHQLVLFGRYYCKSSNPMCDTCSIKDICKYKRK